MMNSSNAVQSKVPTGKKTKKSERPWETKSDSVVKFSKSKIVKTSNNAFPEVDVKSKKSGDSKSKSSQPEQKGLPTLEINSKNQDITDLVLDSLLKNNPDIKEPKGKQKDLVESKFVSYKAKETLLKEINEEFEGNVFKQFMNILLRSPSITVSPVNMDQSNLDQEEFKQFLFRTFPRLQRIIDESTIDLKSSDFYKDLFNRKNYQIDCGFLIYKFENSKEDVNFKITVNSSVIKLRNPSLLIIEVTTTNTPKKMDEKVRQIVVNLLISWFKIHQKIDSEGDIKKIFEDKIKKTTSSANPKTREQKLREIVKNCLFVTNGNLESKAGMFNRSYNKAMNNPLFSHIMEHIQYTHVELSEENSENQQLVSLFNGRAEKNFKVQHVAIHDNIYCELHDMKDLSRYHYTKLSNRMVAMENRMIAMENRMISMDNRMISMEN